MEEALRIKRLPPYLFARIDKMLFEADKRGVDVISFGIGDPDLPTPDPVVKQMGEEIKRSTNHRYPSYEGLMEFRQAVVDWHRDRFGVQLDPEHEVISLIGCKEGLAHFPLAFIEPGDLALVPDPAYPVYKTAVILAGGEVYHLPLKEEQLYLVDYTSIPENVVKRAKILFLNYPNNPTTATAPLSFLQKSVDFAREHDLIIVHDAAYSEITLGAEQSPSILQVQGAKEVAIEFFSFSKTFNMTGWRIGWAAGNPFLIGALGKLKTNIDSGIFSAIQYAAIEALVSAQDSTRRVVEIYKERRDLLCKGLREQGACFQEPEATFYLWVRVPKGFSSEDFSSYVFKKTGVFLTPGVGYGRGGEGYVRLSLTLSEERIREALERIKEANIVFHY